MTTELTVSAFRKLYSEPALFLVGADALRAVQPTLAPGMPYLVLGETGTVSCPDENDRVKGQMLAPVGMAIGLKGIIVGPRTRAAAREWEALARKHGMFDTAPVLEIKGRPKASYLDVSKFILAQSNRYATDLQRQMAHKEAGMAYLRQKNEQILLTFEKARRMIRGAGFGVHQMAAELLPGSDTVGPGGTIDTNCFTQILPSDTAGLWSIGLFFISDAEPAEIPEGQLDVKVVRASDGVLLASECCPYCHLSGWHLFHLEKACAEAFGDAILMVRWNGGEGRVPLVALADTVADRFGDEAGRTAAIQLYKGLGDVFHDKVDKSDVHAELVDWSTVGAIQLKSRQDWAFGELVPALADDQPLITMDEDWVQTHVQPGNPSGIRVAKTLLPGIQDVEVTVRTAHEAGPACLYSMIVVEKREGENDDVRAAKVLEFLKNGTTDGYLDQGIKSCHKLVEPQKETILSLDFAEPLQHEADLFLVVLPADKSASYGWCRWYNLRIGRPWNAGCKTLAPLPMEKAALGYRMRSLKFPDLAGRIEFISGAAELDALSKQLGFSPLLISEETGSLQTHPLKDQVSAAVLPLGVPKSTVRVACDVETAHDAAPAFMYIMAVVSGSVKEKELAIRNVIGRIDPQNKKTWFGINGRRTIQWTANTLFARQAKTLQLELELPTDGPADLVMAVKPVGSSVSYGWCRWYSLNIMTSPVQTRRDDLEHDG